MAGIDPSVLLQVSQQTGISPAQIAMMMVSNPGLAAQLFAKASVEPPSASADAGAPKLGEVLAKDQERAPVDTSPPPLFAGPTFPGQTSEPLPRKDAPLPTPEEVPQVAAGQDFPQPGVTVPTNVTQLGAELGIDTPGSWPGAPSILSALGAALSGVKAPEGPPPITVRTPDAPRPSGQIPTGALEALLGQLGLLKRGQVPLSRAIGG